MTFIFKPGIMWPLNFPQNCIEKVWWRCNRGHEWSAKINNKNRPNRKIWSEAVRYELESTIKDQVDLWGPLLLVVFLGNSGDQSDTPANYVRVLEVSVQNTELFYRHTFHTKESSPFAFDLKIDARLERFGGCDWGSFRRLQDVFKKLGDAWDRQTVKRNSLILAYYIFLNIGYQKTI